jgi:hypothetical protein
LYYTPRFSIKSITLARIEAWLFQTPRSIQPWLKKAMRPERSGIFKPGATDVLE